MVCSVGSLGCPDRNASLQFPVFFLKGREALLRTLGCRPHFYEWRPYGASLQEGLPGRTLFPL